MLGKECVKGMCEGGVSLGSRLSPGDQLCWSRAFWPARRWRDWSGNRLNTLLSVKAAQVGGFWGMLLYPVPLDTPSRGQDDHPLHTELGRGQALGLGRARS